MKSTSDIKESVVSIAVVICTHNRPAALERCLKKLQQVEGQNFSVLVIDSAPNSYEAKVLATRYGAQYIVSPLKGASRARNIGTRATDAEIIAYLDDDMIPHERWLFSLVNEFTDKDVMAVTGPVLALELSAGNDTDLRLAVELAPWGPFRFQIDQNSRQWVERTSFGGIGDGNFAVRHSGFDIIGGLNEGLGRGAAIDASEEHYAYFRIVEHGFKVAYTPKAVVFHPSSRMTVDVLRKHMMDTVAFAAFLAWNHPLRSLRVARFFLEGFLSARRWWRTSPKYEGASISFGEKVGCGINGLSIFFRSLRQSQLRLGGDDNRNAYEFSGRKDGPKRTFGKTGLRKTGDD